MHEIEERFTGSELAIVAWRSQESYHQMSQKMKRAAPPQADGKPGLEGIPERFFNEEGELDLRRATGVEAWNIMRKLGHRLPMIPVEDRALKEKK